MTRVTIEEAQARLPELIDAMPPGEGVVIIRNSQPLAELIRFSPENGYPMPGRCKGMLAVRSEDETHDQQFELLPASEFRPSIS